MQKKINILNELREINSAVLIDTANQTPFFVPENYFDDLADIIKAHIVLSSISSLMPYKVPENYFNNFPDVLTDKLKIRITESNSDYDKKTYSVPDRYFENLATNVLNRIKANAENASVHKELELLSPFLSSLPKKNVFAVPNNYFNNLNPSTKLNVNNSEPAKLISIGSKIRRSLKYAVAACFAALLLGGGYLYFSKKPVNGEIAGSQSSPTMAKMDVQKEISGLSDDEINSYLKDNNNIAVFTNSGDADQQPNIDVQTLLQNVSDEEIQQYLNQDAASVETGGGI